METSICPVSLGWNFEGQRINKFALSSERRMPKNVAICFTIIKITSYIPIISIISTIFEIAMIGVAISNNCNNRTVHNKIDATFMVIRCVTTLFQLGVVFLPIDLIITIANAIITKKYNNKHGGGGDNGSDNAPKYTPPKPTYTPPEYTYTPPEYTYTPPKPTYTPPEYTYTPPKPTYTPRYDSSRNFPGTGYTPRYTHNTYYTPPKPTYTPRYDSSRNFPGTGYTPRYTHNTYYTPPAASAPSELTKFKEDALSLTSLPNPMELHQIKDKNDEAKLLFEMLKKIKEGRSAQKVWDLKDKFTKKDVMVRYRDLAKQFHPDKWAGAGLSGEATEHINLIASYLSVSKELLEQSACL